jgi:hypothetical protein
MHFSLKAAVVEIEWVVLQDLLLPGPASLQGLHRAPYRRYLLDGRWRRSFRHGLELIPALSVRSRK